MKSVTLAVVLIVVGCRGQATTEQAAPATARAQRLQIVYELDLARAVDDRHVSIRRDLDVALADRKIRAAIRVAPDGLAITPEDTAKKAEIEALLQADYSDTIQITACEAASVCVKTSASMTAAIRKSALEAATETIRHRLDAMKVREPSVFRKGEQIVIEVDPNDDRAKAMRATIARTGKLEFRIVDSGSDFMKGVYAISSEDPRARELGIRGEIDQWRPEDGGGIQIDYYFVAADRDKPEMTGRKAIETYLAEIGVRDPRYQVRPDRQIGYERIEPLPEAKDRHAVWRSYYLERVAELTGRDVANAMGTYDPTTNRPLVLLDFTRAGGQTLADVTARNVGKKLATVLDDQVRSAPIINGTIGGGRVSITMGGSDPKLQEIERDELIEVLKTGSLPAPLREVSSTLVP